MNVLLQKYMQVVEEMSDGKEDFKNPVRTSVALSKTCGIV